ncbi:MAG: hypothetical protein M3Y48_14950 [Actinomycetota bacterium]|nr:hypothetical protein [Actinomycetota bacterium]
MTGAPSHRPKATIWRVVTSAEGNQVHLVAAATNTDALVLGQFEVGAKTNEIPCSPHYSTGSPTPVSTWHKW